jgi:hypothetical protein
VAPIEGRAHPAQENQAGNLHPLSGRPLARKPAGSCVRRGRPSRRWSTDNEPDRQFEPSQRSPRGLPREWKQAFTRSATEWTAVVSIRDGLLQHCLIAYVVCPRWPVRVQSPNRSRPTLFQGSAGSPSAARARALSRSERLRYLFAVEMNHLKESCRPTAVSSPERYALVSTPIRLLLTSTSPTSL